MDKTIVYQQALMDEIKAVPPHALPNLLQIVHLFKESILQQRCLEVEGLNNELAEWDRLSDEALAQAFAEFADEDRAPANAALADTARMLAEIDLIE